jgi:uncharacterized protein (TIGR02598 family)
MMRRRYTRTTRSREPLPRRPAATARQRGESGFGHAGGSATIRAVTDRSGFSLVEIMLALAVIAIGLVAVIGLIPQGIQASRDAADNTLAATIVQDTFNLLRQETLESTFTWSSLSGIQNIYYDSTGTNQIITAIPTANTYYDVNLVFKQTTPNYVSVAATVMWPVKTGVTKPLNTNSFVTVIANYQH